MRKPTCECANCWDRWQQWLLEQERIKWERVYGKDAKTKAGKV